MKMNKNLIIVSLFTVWFIFSLAYIGRDIWQDFQNKKALQAYNQGKAETIQQIINKANECQPFSFFVDDKTINLVKTDCPQFQNQGANPAPQTEE